MHSGRTGLLLQRSADVVNAVFGVPWIHHFEDHVVTGLYTLDDGIELILGTRWLLVDSDDNQPGLETLQVSKRSRANRLDNYARGVQARSSLIGDLANDKPELFACIAGCTGSGWSLRSAGIGKDFVAIADSDISVTRLAVTQETEANTGAGVAAGDRSEEHTSELQ